MITPELIKYIEEQRRKSISDEYISTTLVNNGWGENEVKSAFDQIDAVENHNHDYNHGVGVGLSAYSSPVSISGREIWTLVITAFLGLVATGNFIYFYYWQHSLQRVVLGTVGNISQLESVNFSLVFDIDGFDVLSLAGPDASVFLSEEGLLSLYLSLKGGADWSRSYNVKSWLNADLFIPELVDESVKFQYILYNYYLYIKTQGVSKLPGLEELKEYEGKWLRSIMTRRDQRFFWGLISGFVNENIAQERNGFGGIKRAYSNIGATSRLDRQFEVVKYSEGRLPTESLNGVKTQKFALTVDLNEFVDYYDYLHKRGLLQEPFDDKEVENFKNVLKVLQPYEFFTFSFWVGNKDFFPYRVEAVLGNGGTNTKSKLKNVRFILDLNNHNQGIEVEIPQDYEDIGIIF